MPRIQTFSPYGWSNRAGNWKIAPAYVYFGYGAGYEAARIKNIRWTYYHHGSAYAAHVRAWWDNCVPTCVSGGHYVNARAYFWHPASHRGPGWNFSEVRVTYQRGGTYLAAYIDGHGGWIAVP